MPELHCKIWRSGGPQLTAARQAKRVRYFGTVQGVGFRRRTERLAQDLPVYGWVRNLTDGSVEVHAEGDPSVVDELLGRITQGMAREIARQSAETVPPENFSEFSIRR